MTEELQWVLGGLSGAAAGTLSGFLGLGGGAILAPLLARALSMSQHQAQGLSLAALLPPVVLPALYTYRRLGVRIDLWLVALLVAGFGLGGAAGAWTAHFIPDELLRRVFALYLVVAALRVVTARQQEDAPTSAAHGRMWAVPIGFAGGALSGILGVGGGIVVLPLLRRLLGHDRLTAQATTLAMLVPPIALPAVLVYARESAGFSWGLLLAVGAGFAVGATAGARYAGKLVGKGASWVQAAVFIGVALLLVSGGR